jgi:hypothetical protein
VEAGRDRGRDWVRGRPSLRLWWLIGLGISCLLLNLGAENGGMVGSIVFAVIYSETIRNILFLRDCIVSRVSWYYEELL